MGREGQVQEYSVDVLSFIHDLDRFDQSVLASVPRHAAQGNLHPVSMQTAPLPSGELFIVQLVAEADYSQLGGRGVFTNLRYQDHYLKLTKKQNVH